MKKNDNDYTYSCRLTESILLGLICFLGLILMSNLKYGMAVQVDMFGYKLEID